MMVGKIPLLLKNNNKTLKSSNKIQKINPLSLLGFKNNP